MGTYEFFAAGALTILGISGSEALAFALVLHGIAFVGSSLLGAICLALAGGSLAQMSAESQRQQEISMGPLPAGRWDPTHRAGTSGRE